MAGIKVPQYEVFKIGTNKLKASNWDLHISKSEALDLNEMIPLFEGQEFRLIAKILNKPIYKIDFSKYICSIVIDKLSHFKRATSKKGIKINGITYKRFVGTTGGLKNNSILFINADIIDELNRRCECGRDKNIKLVPAKYEAYKALTCSASQKIISPERILVVRDCIVKTKDTIISLDNSNPLKDSPIREIKENFEIENNCSDGYNLCTYEFMEKVSEALGLDYVTNGVCLRNAWLKGMLYAFPIVEFFDKYRNGNYLVEDIWGEIHDIREIDMIVTESSLKLWSGYKNIQDYVDNYKKNGYEFSVTKICSNHLEDYRELNYQYLQSYEFNDSDIEELCKPTVDFLKNSMCGDYQSTLDFIGANGNEMEMSWQKALSINEYMLGDPYVIDSVNRMIKKKIDNAKIGKLIVHGNYQILSGDPFALMQSIAGLEVTGLLKAGECYSHYWIENDIDESPVNDIVTFRSPMTSHNNIRHLKVVNNSEAEYWYQYMSNIFIINAWDASCQTLNGADFDGDLVFSTNNPVLIRKHKVTPAICCAQSTTSKVIVTEEEIKKTNLNGMGNKVGTITNRITTMMEVLSHFKKGSNEYEELMYRIECGQLYQQDEIDRLKGIIAKPMPDYWFNMGAAKKHALDNNLDVDYYTSICIDKKPYFMTYIYSDYRKKYVKYLNDCETRCAEMFNNMTISELMSLERKTQEQEEFLYWFHFKHPFGTGLCAMNRICYHIENEFAGYKSSLKANSSFDYNDLKVKKRCTEEHRKALKELQDKYIGFISDYKESKARNSKYDIENNIMTIDSESEINNRISIQKNFYEKAKEICPDDAERLNIVLDITYAYKGNKQFCWDIIGDLICNRLEDMKK